MRADGPVTSDELLFIERGAAARRYWTDMWRYRELFSG
jgi:hypothetical protein